MRVFFMGTPDFAKTHLQALAGSGYDICGIFTNPDAPKGRGMRFAPSPVKAFGTECGFDVFTPQKLRDGTAYDIIRSKKPDVIAVVAYGRLLPEDILELPPLGSINIHGSLLPKYRGASPIQSAIAAGERESGVTSMYMSREMDAGDIIFQKSTPIGVEETAGELHDRLAVLGSELLVETLEAIENGCVRRICQKHENATFTKILTKSDGVIDFNQNSDRLCAFIRGMTPWPGASLGNLRVLSAENAGEGFEGVPGTVLPDGILVCGNKTGLKLIRVQAPGGKAMPYPDYARGLRK